jgi:hypothetical protein
MDLYLEAWDAGVREAWIAGLQSLADAVGGAMLVAMIVLVPMAVLLTPRMQRRRMVCPLKGRPMLVQMEACGVPGLLWSATVRSCSAFVPPTAVGCDSACLRGCAGNRPGARPDGLPA